MPKSSLAGVDPMTPVVPAGLSSKVAADPMVVSKPLMTLQDAPVVEGGHSAAASLAKKFDGAVERPRGAEKKSDAQVLGGVGVGASGSGSDWTALPQFGPKGAAFRKPEAAEVADVSSDRPRARQARASASNPQAAAVKTVPDDFTYTYLSPAQHSYDFSKDQPQRPDDSAGKLLADMALRLSAAGAVGYLLLYSNLPYIIGLSRRKRRQ